MQKLWYAVYAYAWVRVPPVRVCMRVCAARPCVHGRMRRPSVCAWVRAPPVRVCMRACTGRPCVHGRMRRPSGYAWAHAPPVRVCVGACAARPCVHGCVCRPSVCGMGACAARLCALSNGKYATHRLRRRQRRSCHSVLSTAGLGRCSSKWSTKGRSRQRPAMTFMPPYVPTAQLRITSIAICCWTAPTGYCYILGIGPTSTHAQIHDVQKKGLQLHFWGYMLRRKLLYRLPKQSSVIVLQMTRVSTRIGLQRITLSIRNIYLENAEALTQHQSICRHHILLKWPFLSCGNVALPCKHCKRLFLTQTKQGIVEEEDLCKYKALCQL
jgi:hypothetical protein